MDYRALRNYVESVEIKELRLKRSVYSQAVLKRYVKVIMELGGSKVDLGLWFYVGEERDHIIVPKSYCSCKYFTINVVADRKAIACPHIFGQRIAEEEGLYRVITVDLDCLKKILAEALSYGVSPTIRKHLVTQVRGNC
ncbi:MAG: hypothetical protein N3E36_00770 [Sulfolobales archaeon]|nr:hypothetical protein [Sulfolobales archaeon]MCX8198551.1 hypothetical protein [Sulfolobales archaeon]MDW8169624.1 hypothetical protein [Desulfurococcaceae archaeon]